MTSALGLGVVLPPGSSSNMKILMIICAVWRPSELNPSDLYQEFFCWWQTTRVENLTIREEWSMVNGDWSMVVGDG